MTDGDALRRAVLADPDDDTARLVYADWLQENGQADRAEFIRAQIEAVRADPFGLQALAATRRADDLLRRHGREWTRHLEGGFAEYPRFERGFVAHLSVEPRGFAPRADALLDAEPVQALTLYRFAGVGERVSFEPLFELPRLRQLRRLGLSSMLFTDPDADEYALLSGCPHLANLRDLSLGRNPVPPAWLSAVLTGEKFPELAGLDLAEVTHLGPCLTESLPGANHRELKRLDLTGVRFNTSEMLKHVLESRCLKRAEELRLGCTPRAGAFGPLFHLDLSWVIPWERLVVLDLAGQQLGNEGVREITAHKGAAALRWLGLRDNHLGPDAVRYLADSKYLALNYLDVRGHEFSPRDLAALHHRFPTAVIVS
jgi:uncharacterized protein (TIGR02996 family)